MAEEGPFDSAVKHISMRMKEEHHTPKRIREVKAGISDLTTRLFDDLEELDWYTIWDELGTKDNRTEADEALYNLAGFMFAWRTRNAANTLPPS